MYDINNVPSEVVELAEKSDLALCDVQELTITTDEQYTNAGEVLLKLKTDYKTLDEKRKELTKPIDEAKQKIMDWFRPHLTNLQNGIDFVGSKLTEFVKKQEMVRKALEEKLAKEAKEKEEIEKAKIQKQIEKAEKSGNADKVQELQQKKADVFIPSGEVVISTPKVAGIGARKTWKHVVEDFKALPDEYKLANNQMLSGLAKSTKGKMVIPGVRFYEDTTVGGVRK